MLEFKQRNSRAGRKYARIVAICLLAGVPFAAGHEFDTKLNQLLASVAEKEPALFGADALCERADAFWNAVKASSLLAVLAQQEGFKAITLDQKHTVWFIPISPCFSGNRPGFAMFVRNDSVFKRIERETPITGDIENVRLKGNTIIFDVTTYAGMDNAYRYRYIYDGKQLTEVLLERVLR